jgi:hypothetical protein
LANDVSAWVQRCIALLIVKITDAIVVEERTMGGRVSCALREVQLEARREIVAYLILAYEDRRSVLAPTSKSRTVESNMFRLAKNFLVRYLHAVSDQVILQYFSPRPKRWLLFLRV